MLKGSRINGTYIEGLEEFIDVADIQFLAPNNGRIDVVKSFSKPPKNGGKGHVGASAMRGEGERKVPTHQSLLVGQI